MDLNKKFEEFVLRDTDGSFLGYDHEGMLAYLLLEDILFCGSAKWVNSKEEVQSDTILIYVTCNDVFAWACADAESITRYELPDLCKLYIEEKYSIVKWVCKKRNMRPQLAFRKDMKEAGEWPEWMDKLEPNYDEGE